MRMDQTILLTGRRGVGKTTICQAIAELARRRGYRPGGVITPALSNSHGVKVGFEAVDVGSGERWLLARTAPSTSSGHRQELGGPRVGPYSLDPIALDRALKVLRRAISPGCDLLIIDEIGPLELEQGEGFAPILDLLPVEGPTHTLIVVRPALLDPLLLRLRDAVGRPCRTGFTVFIVTEENRDELPLRIVEKLWEDRHCCAVR
jgi:nucleoside-triphosphatase THEP1